MRALAHRLAAVVAATALTTGALASADPLVDRLAALGAIRVVAGHKRPGLSNDASAIAYTQRYLKEFEQAVSTSKTSAELSAKMRAAFPDTIDWMDFLLGNSSKVALEEMPPWQE